MQIEYYKFNLHKIMLKRTLKKKLKESAKLYPVVVLTGPRQSGKTTLVKMTFLDHDYISLEEPNHRKFAPEDPIFYRKTSVDIMNFKVYYIA